MILPRPSLTRNSRQITTNGLVAAKGDPPDVALPPCEKRKPGARGKERDTPDDHQAHRRSTNGLALPKACHRLIVYFPDPIFLDERDSDQTILFTATLSTTLGRQ